ncbi:hypothetical protein L249_6063, partial [Ophiocordyceps polyrhachis-furcata BCC 54312]
MNGSSRCGPGPLPCGCASTFIKHQPSVKPHALETALDIGYLSAQVAIYHGHLGEHLFLVLASRHANTILAK